MLRLPPFRYLAPRSLDAAVRALGEAGPNTMLVAGGTDLYPNMKRRQFEPSTLVGLRGVGELGGVRGRARDGLVLGAGTTLRAVAAHPEVRRHYPAVAEAAGLVSSPALRAMGTIGGNVCVDTRCTYYNQTHAWRQAAGFCMKKDGDVCLVAPGSPRCWAVSSSDTAPVFLSLGARVRLAGPHGERELPMAAFYRDDGIAYLAKDADEVLTEIALPPADGWRSAYLKLRRRGSIDFPILGVAVAVRLDGEVVRDARIVLGAVASLPREVPAAAGALRGERLTADVIERVAGLAAGPAKPLDNTDLTHPYRKKMTRVFVARALGRLAGLPEGA